MNKSFFIIIIVCFLFAQDVYSQQIISKKDSIIKLGLLINDDKSFDARNGAKLAIDIANKKRDPNKLNFKLEVRSMEGPWGTGSKEVVNLIFEDKE